MRKPQLLRLARAIHAVASTFARGTEFQHLAPLDQDRYIAAAKAAAADLEGKASYFRSCVNCGDDYPSKCMDSKRCQKCRTLGKRA